MPQTMSPKQTLPAEQTGSPEQRSHRQILNDELNELPVLDELESEDSWVELFIRRLAVAVRNVGRKK
jgi:hypothetical protein